MKEIAQEREQEIQSTTYSQNDFDSPSWSHKTAFRNGQLSILKLLKELVPF